MQVSTVSKELERRLERTPDAPFFHCGELRDRWVTLRELDDRSARVAGGLANLGVGRGDRVALLSPNRVEMIELLFAMAKSGAIQVPLNYWVKGDFLRYQLSDCGAKVLVTDQLGYDTAAGLLAQTGVERVVLLDGSELPPNGVHYDELLAAAPTSLVAAEPHDLISISYTSGTTANPKGCMLSTGYYTAVGIAYGELKWVVPGDRVYTAYPLFHTSGQMVTFMAALVNDASIAVAPEFHASTYISDAAALQATALNGVGPMGHAILEQPVKPGDGAHPFRLAVWVPLPAERQREFEERFRTPVMSEGYGQTECVPITSSYVDGQRNRETSGQPAPLVEVQIEAEDGRPAAPGEPGEIVVRPRVPNAMYSGYWNKPEETVTAWRNLWHHTGDFGRMDEHGFLSFVDRKKDVLRRRGENVSSLYVETVLRELPGVADVAVCAVPSSLGDDDIKACIVEKAPGELTPDAVFEFLRERVAYFAIPRYVQLREALPVNALGRVMKHRLRDEGVPDGCWDLEKLGLVVPRQERRGKH